MVLKLFIGIAFAFAFLLLNGFFTFLNPNSLFLGKNSLNWKKNTFSLGRTKNKNSNSNSNELSDNLPNLVDNLDLYGNQIVLRFNLNTTNELAILAKVSDELNLDVWSLSLKFTDILIEENNVDNFLNLLPKNFLNSYYISISNLQDLILNSYPKDYLNTYFEYFDNSSLSSESYSKLTKIIEKINHNKNGNFKNKRRLDPEVNLFYHDYQPLNKIYKRLFDLEKNYSNIMSIESIGKSFENRDIYAIRIGENVNDRSPYHSRPGLLISGTQHAREWISAASSTFLIEQLVAQFRKKKAIKKILSKYDIVIIPVVNVDGYEYSWSTDRLWRKNRQPTDVPFCFGIDPDRSYSWQWNSGHDDEDQFFMNNDNNIQNELLLSNNLFFNKTSPLSNNSVKPFGLTPCSGFYPGSYPFEAIESKLIALYILNTTTNYGVNMKAFIDLHSYSQEILYPYAYSCSREPRDLENLEELGYNLAQGIRQSSGRIYSVGPACEVREDYFDVSLSSDRSSNENNNNSNKISNRDDLVHILDGLGGAAMDYMYHNHLLWSFQIKLRDTGSYGYLLPSYHIIPSGKELLNLLIKGIKFLTEPD